MAYDDIKKCPYCGGNVEVDKNMDGSGALVCTSCYQRFEHFGRLASDGEIDASINRFNKFLGK